MGGRETVAWFLVVIQVRCDALDWVSNSWVEKEELNEWLRTGLALKL